MQHRLSLLTLVAVLLAACEAPEPRDAVASGMEEVPLYANLGNHSYAITTGSDVAQGYFDQGLRLLYAFNHPEAIRAFGEATRLDPSCAMCYWGIAYALGPNINAGMDPGVVADAVEAARMANERAENASPIERALIGALGVRYALDAPEDRAALDSAYASAMGEVRALYPGDHEVLTLHAEALMDLSPWNYWNPDGSARPATGEILANLEQVIAADPNHPGACHFFIHAVEATQPQRAVECAERLAGLMPGAGHLVHMPGHIYIRVGRYMDAIRANEHAVHADETFIRDQRPGVNIYVLGYYPHNYDFLAFAASMAGRREQALGAARQVESLVPLEMLREPGMGFLQQGLTAPLRTMVRFGRWQEIMSAPAPDNDLPYARGIWHFARGMAHTAGGDLAAAETELDALRTLAADPELADLIVGFNPGSHVLGVAVHVLAGEIALRREDPAAAVRLLEQGAALEDELVYGEPPDWPIPVRNYLGGALLSAGRPADAERVYREDLARFPENGWSLIGLRESLRAQERGGDAEEVAERFDAAWSQSDTQIPASRF